MLMLVILSPVNVLWLFLSERFQNFAYIFDAPKFQNWGIQMWYIRIHCSSYSAVSFNLETLNLFTLEIYLQLFIWLFPSSIFICSISRDSVLLIRCLNLLKCFPCFYFLTSAAFLFVFVFLLLCFQGKSLIFPFQSTLELTCKSSSWFSGCSLWSFLFLFCGYNFCTSLWRQRLEVCCYCFLIFFKFGFDVCLFWSLFHIERFLRASGASWVFLKNITGKEAVW